MDGPDAQAFGDGSWDAGLDTSNQYGFAFPQYFAQVALNRTRIKFGHFLSFFGYERVQAPLNFFYSHSLASGYNVPYTWTGLACERQWTPNLTSFVARVGGWDAGFGNDNDGKSTNLGLRWQPAERFWMLGGLSWGDPGDSPTSDSDVYLQNLVVNVGLTERLRYVADHTFQTRRSAIAVQETAFKQYGLANYLLWDLTERFGLGARYEWFYAGAGTPPPLGVPSSVPGSHFHNLTFATNFRLRPRMLLKPEFRYDWVDNDGPTPGGPFDEAQRRSQATWGLQSIIVW